MNVLSIPLQAIHLVRGLSRAATDAAALATIVGTVAYVAQKQWWHPKQIRDCSRKLPEIGDTISALHLPADPSTDSDKGYVLKQSVTLSELQDFEVLREHLTTWNAEVEIDLDPVKQVLCNQFFGTTLQKKEIRRAKTLDELRNLANAIDAEHSPEKREACVCINQKIEGQKKACVLTKEQRQIAERLLRDHLFKLNEEKSKIEKVAIQKPDSRTKTALVALALLTIGFTPALLKRI